MIQPPHPLDPDPLEQSDQVLASHAPTEGNPSDGASHIPAEVATDAFRFGIKSLAAIVILPAVVLATISYFGMLLGLLASLGLSCLLLGLTFFIGVAFHRRLDCRLMRHLDVWTVLLSLLTVGLFFGVAFAGGSQAAVYFLSDLKLGKEYNEKLGFTHDIEQNLNNDQYVRTIRVKSLSPGGEFEKAGFLPGDVIVDYDAKQFFRELENSPGQQVTVSVATGVSANTMTDLSKNPQRKLTINVPNDD